MDDVTETVDEPPAAVTSEEALQMYEETMFDSADVVEFAPGEGERPLSLLTDPDCEELAFPTIFFGHKRIRAEHAKLSYAEICKSELRRSDRRAVRPDHLLFVNKKVQLQQLCSNINIALKKRSREQSITVSQALSSDFIDSTVALDNAFRFTNKITGTPGYWEAQKKNVLAMVRQFGVFTLFVTLSAAEAQWPELLRILKETVDKETVDLDYVANMDYAEKARLIRSDPVTCALYFNHRFRELKKTWFGDNSPFAGYKIVHMYHRIEFQHRGSPHVHMIIWLEEAPLYDPEDESSEDIVTAFIDSIATTSTEEDDIQGIEDFVKYQHHKCTHTCRKTVRGNTKCRFGAPFPPMERTRILKPLPEDYEVTVERFKELRDVILRMNALLDGDVSTLATFEDFLTKLNVNLDEYLLAIRSQLKSTKIFIKREPKSTRINQYNKKILGLMRSNMDIQFVLDPFSCIQYVVDYINKSQRGLSKLMRDCVENVQFGNFTVRQKLKAVSNTLYNGAEISAQEAAWCRLQLPMAQSSDGVEFINTSSMKVRKCFIVDFKIY